MRETKDSTMLGLINNTNQNKMAKEKGKSDAGFFEKFALLATKATGSNYAFLGAFAMVLAWALCGPAFHYSEIWQMVINTFTTIITFLMVFLIQKAQNKDSLAIQLKLNELVAAHESASNRLVDIENMTEEELRVIQKYYNKLSNFTKPPIKFAPNLSRKKNELSRIATLLPY